MAKSTDRNLLDALTKAYTARARLFHDGVRGAGIDLLIVEIDSIDTSHLVWDRKKFGISDAAFERLQQTGGLPHQIFAHPDIIQSRPHLIAYYRNLVTISKKGISQILVATERFESRKKRDLDPADALGMSRLFNRIISGIVGSTPGYEVQLSRQAILAEIGTELQGTWANRIGKGAARAVEDMLFDYIDRRKLGKRLSKRHYELTNGWRIVFGSEPDVAFIDDRDVTQIAIEIKGSLDVNGAQTRYGETKKSFAKQLKVNPRCHTVYLASCYTDAVVEQIKADGQVRDWFNLTSILYDAQERDHFLERLFHIVSTPSRRRRASR